MPTLAVAALVAWPSFADAQAIGYALSPSGALVRWDDALGWEDSYLYGGRLGLRFGPFVELQPFVYVGDAALTDSTPTGEDAEHEIDLRHAGASLQVNLTRGNLVPFVRLGGGVLRLAPATVEPVGKIALHAGGGVRLGLGGVQAELFAEDLAFRGGGSRLNAAEEEENHHNLALGAGLVIPISSFSEGASAGGLRGGAIPLEPFAGRLSFANEVGLADQNVLGVRTGIDFNSLFGARGFYWKGITEDIDGTDPVQAYGGEAQFNLNTGPGLSPYLVAGAGRLDFGEEFRDSSGVNPTDRNLLILGGGLGFGLSDRVRLNVSARDYLFAAEELEQTRTTNDLLHNLMLSAGLTFSIGGRSGARSGGDPALEALAAETERLRLENERLRGIAPVTQVDTVVVINDSGERVVREIVTTRVGNQRTLTVPVPDEGEIILRYGPNGTATGGITMAEIREAVRAELEGRTATDPNVVVVPGQPGVDPEALEARLSAMERRLAERVDAEVERRVREELERRAAEVVVTDNLADTLTVVEQPSILSRLTDFDIRQTLPYLGVNVDDPTQLIVGGRVNFGPITPNSRIDFLPEVAFGIGEDDPTLLVAANLRYSFGSTGGDFEIRPYVTAGAGFFSRSFLAVNAALGTSFDLRNGLDAPRAFVEYQGVNLYERNRLLVGVTLNR